MNQAAVARETLAYWAMQSLPQGLAVVAADGLIILANDAWQAHVEHAGASFLHQIGEGSNLLAQCEAMTGSQSTVAQFCASNLRQLLAHEQSGFEIEFEASGAERRWYRLHGMLASHFEGAILSLAEMTTTVAADGRLRKLYHDWIVAERLAALDEIHALFAHQINQPLSAIASYSQGIVRGLTRGVLPQEEVIAVAGKIASEALRAGGALNSLPQAWAKPETSDAVANLGTLVDEALSFLEPALREHSIAIHFDLAADVPAVHADPVRLRHLIISLLDRALRALAGAPAIERQLTIETRALPNAASLRLCFRQTPNTGDGQPAEQRWGRFKTIVSSCGGELVTPPATDQLESLQLIFPFAANNSP